MLKLGYFISRELATNGLLFMDLVSTRLTAIWLTKNVIVFEHGYYMLV